MKGGIVTEAVTDDDDWGVEEGGDDGIHEHDNDDEEDLEAVAAAWLASLRLMQSLITTM